MYVCICNALCDKMIQTAIESGARDIDSVYASHGCAPVCGRCKPVIRDFLGDSGDGPATEARAAAPLPAE